MNFQSLPTNLLCRILEYADFNLHYKTIAQLSQKFNQMMTSKHIRCHSLQVSNRNGSHSLICCSEFHDMKVEMEKTLFSDTLFGCLTQLMVTTDGREDIAPFVTIALAYLNQLETLCLIDNAKSNGQKAPSLLLPTKKTNFLPLRVL